ncbi:MAG: asparagine synthase-related protein [Candidatus Gastranaerophilales bacterium]
MSHYLSLRYIDDESYEFFEGLNHKVHRNSKILQEERIPCKTAQDIDFNIKNIIEEEFVAGKTAILLSGGIDSAILASYLPEGTKAYTMHCVADGAINETAQAKKYCDYYNLDHSIVDISWEDFEKYTPEIIKDANVPVHSIEILLHKAILQAKADGIEYLVVGDSADSTFGGFSKLLSKDWTLFEFMENFVYTKPEKVLKNPVSMIDIYKKYCNGDFFNTQEYIKDEYAKESLTSYLHAFEFGNIDYIAPYTYLKMAEPLDLDKVRSGESKYLLRELFKLKYPHLDIPEKIPMPRATEQWFKDWEGPKREEFLPNCVSGLTGDQKWQVYCLELFLNIFDKGE